MISLKSKTLCDYYSNNPNEYYIKFIHHNIDIKEESLTEYKNLEEDLKKIYKFDSTAFMLYFSDIDNYEKFINNTGIDYHDKIYLRIRTINEYNSFKELKAKNKIKLIVDIKDIEVLNITDFELVIQVDKVHDLSISKLKELLSKYKITYILLGQIPYLSKDYDYLYDVMSKMYDIDSSRKLELEKINKITNDIYSVDEYIKILEKFQTILEQLGISDTIDGIYKIFHYIANNVLYDDDGVKETKITNQNLIGPVFHNIGVCEGYSKFLQQMLSLIGVNSIVVQGGGTKEEGGHVWNQVLINNKWYNADVTVASYDIRQDKKVSTYLVKDSNLLYKTYTSISYKCNEDFL